MNVPYIAILCVACAGTAWILLMISKRRKR